MESIRPHIIAGIHRDLPFLLASAVSLAKREIGVVPSSSHRELDTLLRALQLEPEILIIDGQIAGVCRYAAGLQDRWPGLTVFVIASDHDACNYCERFPRVPADEGYLVETVSSLIEERAKGTGQVMKKGRRGIQKAL